MGILRSTTAFLLLDQARKVISKRQYASTRVCPQVVFRLIQPLKVCCSPARKIEVHLVMQLLQQQYRITGSFGCRIANIAQSLDKMAGGLIPVIDAVLPVADFAKGLERLESRKVFGKILVTL